MSKKTLREFWEKYSDSEKPLSEWYREVTKVKWNIPQDIIDQFPNARVIPNNRAIFNIKGNKYRLIVYNDYVYHITYICFIGTHSDYEKINAEVI